MFSQYLVPVKEFFVNNYFAYYEYFRQLKITQYLFNSKVTTLTCFYLVCVNSRYYNKSQLNAITRMCIYIFFTWCVTNIDLKFCYVTFSNCLKRYSAILQWNKRAYKHKHMSAMVDHLCYVNLQDKQNTLAEAGIWRWFLALTAPQVYTLLNSLYKRPTILFLGGAHVDKTFSRSVVKCIVYCVSHCPKAVVPSPVTQLPIAKISDGFGSPVFERPTDQQSDNNEKIKRRRYSKRKQKPTNSQRVLIN